MTREYDFLSRTPVLAHPGWHERAACAGVKTDFHPGTSNQRHTKYIRERFCDHCPVIGRCAQQARDAHELFGIWAGVNVHSFKRASDRDRALNDIINQSKETA